MKLLIVILACMVSGSAFAQNETAGVTFDDGLIFKYDPANFKMKFKFRVQGRATYEDFDSDNTKDVDTLDFAIRRMRLRFEGTAYDPRLFYKIQLSFSRADMDWDNNPYPNILRDAVLGWNFTENQTVFIGQTKLPGNRQRIISSGDLELVDRSLLNARYTVDRDIGIQYWGRFFLTHPLSVKLALSNGEGRGSSNDDMGIASTGRLEWQPLGAFSGSNDYVEGDQAHETTPKLALATAYSVNKRSHRLGGQIGEYIDPDDSRDLKSFFIDGVFKFRGWAVSSEYSRRRASNPIVNATQHNLVGEGLNVQASYIFASGYSPVLRYTEIRPDEEIYSVEKQIAQYTVGLSRYFDKHKVKLQGDVTMENRIDRLTQAEQTNWIARAQIQVGI